jgi:FtsH-binding integral membrane protein
MQNLEIGAQILSIVLISFSLVFTLGIIWRVEMKLDTAYKVFFCALVFLFLARVVDIFVKSEVFALAYQLLNLLFSIFLLWGIWLMRDVMRNIDGEKK